MRPESRRDVSDGIREARSQVQVVRRRNSVVVALGVTHVGECVRDCGCSSRHDAKALDPGRAMPHELVGHGRDSGGGQFQGQMAGVRAEHERQSHIGA